MKVEADSPEEYVAQLPEDIATVITKLRQVISRNLPKGFEECISYNGIGFVVPHSVYPEGYHVTPSLPLPFISIASQKNFVALYHSGIYASPTLGKWFIEAYPKYVRTKLDMGKSCIRFKNMTTIPYDLIGELASKMTVVEWVETYEKVIKNK